MIWEALFWVAVAWASLPLLALIESGAEARWPSAWPAVRDLLLWVVGLGPAYLALVRGAVLARSFGLYGSGGVPGWALALIVCAALVAGARSFRQRLSPIVSDENLSMVIQDEPRWALYRAAGTLWFGAWGLLGGLALGAVEWALRTHPWRAERRDDHRTWLILMRLAVSSLLFALTGNFWLTWASQTAFRVSLGSAADRPADNP